LARATAHRTGPACKLAARRHYAKEKQWQDWIARQRRALERTLPTIEPPPLGRFDLGDIKLACTLAYLDFRLSDLSWRDMRPDLSHWLDNMSARFSMRVTAP
jgi:glutathione S-transferase